jgi:hypothetical protein
MSSPSSPGDSTAAAAAAAASRSSRDGIAGPTGLRRGGDGGAEACCGSFSGLLLLRWCWGPDTCTSACDGSAVCGSGGAEVAGAGLGGFSSLVVAVGAGGGRGCSSNTNPSTDSVVLG